MEPILPSPLLSALINTPGIYEYEETTSILKYPTFGYFRSMEKIYTTVLQTDCLPVHTVCIFSFEVIYNLRVCNFEKTQKSDFLFAVLS